MLSLDMKALLMQNVFENSFHGKCIIKVLNTVYSL